MARKYGKKAQRKVRQVMRERKRGTLRSGGSGKKVTSRKQAIAIGLSEARRSGAKGSAALRRSPPARRSVLMIMKCSSALLARECSGSSTEGRALHRGRSTLHPPHASATHIG